MCQGQQKDPLSLKLNLRLFAADCKELVKYAVFCVEVFLFSFVFWILDCAQLLSRSLERKINISYRVQYGIFEIRRFIQTLQSCFSLSLFLLFSRLDADPFRIFHKLTLALLHFFLIKPANKPPPECIINLLEVLTARNVKHLDSLTDLQREAERKKILTRRRRGEQRKHGR